MATISVEMSLEPGEIALFEDVIPFNGFLRKIKVELESGVKVKKVDLVTGNAIRINLISSPVSGNFEKDLEKLYVKSGVKVEVLAENHDTTSNRNGLVILYIGA